MEYVCYECGKILTAQDISRRVRCPHCGGRILFKKRVETVKKVKAR